jgi:hypothetical protein
MQIHDDIAFNRVEAFIRGEDNETLVGTETVKPRKTRKLAPRRAAPVEAAAAGAADGANLRAAAKAGSAGRQG